MDTATPPTVSAFVKEVRRALRHLYNPTELRKSFLLTLVGPDPSSETPSGLRRILIEGIETLRPAPDVPPQSSLWRVYNVMSQRYAEHFTQREVARNLSVSLRQLARLESAGIQALTDQLWARYQVGERLAQDPTLFAPHQGEHGAREVETPTLEQELGWLLRSAPSETVQLAELLRPVLGVTDRLAASLAVTMQVDLPKDLPAVRVQVTIMRQAILALITEMVRFAANSRVRISAEASQGELGLHLLAFGASHVSRPKTGASHDGKLGMARQLLALSGTAIAVAEEDSGARLAIRLALPTADQIPVLVIDDNADTLRLLERYLSGTRYRFIGSTDAEEALRLALELRPSAIVLDVMLPRLDGWELIDRLREHPHTRGASLIVCTVLPQDELATLLGAAMLIRKPVTRRAFLEALDQQVRAQA